MRLSQILQGDVFLPDGHRIGHVFDVRVASRTPTRSKRPPSTMRVTHLLVGASAVFARLGYLHRDVKGPPGFPYLARHAKGYAVRWDQIARLEPRRVTLRCGLDELQPIKA